eukprot:scaffold387_cov244-Pinguiococcus_pyrenoidosus.AAC.6
MSFQGTSMLSRLVHGTERTRQAALRAAIPIISSSGAGRRQQACRRFPLESRSIWIALVGLLVLGQAHQRRRATCVGISLPLNEIHQVLRLNVFAQKGQILVGIDRGCDVVQMQDIPRLGVIHSHVLERQERLRKLPRVVIGKRVVLLQIP